MIWLRAIILAFSTYTRLPMPQVKWDEDAMKLSMAFLPVVGISVGGVLWVWQRLCVFFEISPILFAAVAVSLPIIITGGIHMDGYCDTSDALASWQDKERRLEILKDSHVGAFAVIRYGVYMIICFGLLHDIFLRDFYCGIGFLYPLSRCMAAWSAMTIPNARKEGMLAAFTLKAQRKRVSVTLACLTVITVSGWIWFTFPNGLGGLALCLPVSLWYRSMAVRCFGGITGDTTGFYLQITELTLLTGLLTGGIIAKWL